MHKPVVVVVLEAVDSAPAGVPAARWRRALAEDTVDLASTLGGARVAVAATPGECALAEELCWPGMPVYPVAQLTAPAVLAAVRDDGARHAVLLAPDVPDLPDLLIGKLLRPLTSRPVAVAPDAAAADGLAGLASVLPAPPWLPAAPLHALTVKRVRTAAPAPGHVAVSPGWRRMRRPSHVDTLHTAFAGADATRAVLAEAF